ncbi:FecR domain-containing protein [Paenibacillus foliorum]|uniref:FecR domain-containing protein n=1 Tax=Paenibacillus foliorum TaxID=2654974 RepID=UPI0014913E49|nr:FecR domain-containing protein [Paenibacillus foliorum]
MGHSKRMRMDGKKSFLSLVVASCMVFSLLSTTLSKPVEAKSTRAAILVDVNGTVSVKKAGGSKSYTAYKDMSLNEGDVIITGASSSAVLKIADHDDEITISDNAEVSIAELSEQGAGKTSKIKSWAGSLWVKVKSLVSSEDEFEVETPTAVMGVRGTQLGISINPETGIMTVFLAAGKIDASTTTNNGQGGTQETANTILLPSQQLNLDSRDEVKDLNLKVDIIDIDAFIRAASPEVIKALILNKALIDKENQEFIAAKKQEIAENGESNTGDSSLTIKDQSTLDKVSQNLDNLIGNIAKAALAQNKISTAEMNALISEANKKIDDDQKKLDLNKVVPLDKTAGVDAEMERLKKAELEKLNAKKQAELEAKQRLEKEKLEKFKAALEAMEKEKKRIEEENKKAIEAAKQKAETEYLSKLSEEEKKRYEAEKNGSTGNEPAPTPTPSPTPSPSPNRPSTISVKPPVLVNPTANTTNTTGNVEVKLTAATGSNIEILNGDTVVATLPGKGELESIFSLPLQNGIYNLTARAESGGRYSTSVVIPTITVQIPDVLFTQASKDANTVTLQLSMANFPKAKEFYAVQAHLVYNNTLSYIGPKELTDTPNTVFDGADISAETLNQHIGNTQYELIYAASQFEASTSTAEINNITVVGTKALVSIPLTFSPNATGSTKVDLVYVKVVNKNGATVAEFTTPKSITVTK